MLKPGDEATHRFANGRHVWPQVAKGSVELNRQKLRPGDGAAISDEQELTIKGVEDSEALLFDLA